MTVQVKLENFEGPLDLLLHLIRQNEFDIQKLEISKITDQYLDVINRMRTLDVELASEFIVMAATLIYIKSKMMLPKSEDESQEEGPDPREELIRRLMEYEQYKNAAEDLLKRPFLNEDLFRVFLPPRDLTWDFDPKESLIEVGVYELAVAFQDVILKSKKVIHTIEGEELSVYDKIMEIVTTLNEKLNDLIPFDGFVKDGGAKRKEMVVVFLALLEMTKMGYIKLFQSNPLSDIYVQAFKSIAQVEVLNSDFMKGLDDHERRLE